MITLRPYQQECITKILKRYQEGLKLQLMVLATGTGKTLIFGSLANQLIKQTGKKVLVLAHREELLFQARDKILSINQNLQIGIERANDYADEINDDIIIASVPTLGRTNSERILRWNPEDFCLIVIDEAHHATADSYKTILRHFKILKGEDTSSNLLLIGCTATPSRMDNKGIDQIFDEVVFEYDIAKGIKDSYLSRIRAWQVRTTADISNVGKTAGDFNLGQLEEAVNTTERNNLIVKTYKDQLADKKALVFAVDVLHTQELYKDFLTNGVKAAFVTGTTPKEERAQILKDFHNNNTQVLINCQVLTEGYDEESIDAILMARPSQSSILFRQMIGRGTRTFPGKNYLTVIDFVDNSSKHNLQTVASLLGIQANINFKGKDIFETKDQLDKLIDLAPNANLDNIDLDKIDYTIEEVDLLGGTKIPTEIALFTTYDWHRYGEDTYRIGITREMAIYIRQTLTGQYDIIQSEYLPLLKNEQEKVIATKNSMQQAFKAADNYIWDKHHEQVILVNNNAGWRTQPISDKQIELLKKLGVSDIVISQFSKGDAARVITKLFNRQRRQVTI